MKVKTSVTLSEKLLAAIDEVAGPGCNRSAVIEEAATDWVRRRRKDERDRKDAAIYARLKENPEFRREIEETLGIQAPWTDMGDHIELPDGVLARLEAENGASSAAG